MRRRAFFAFWAAAAVQNGNGTLEIRYPQQGR